MGRFCAVFVVCLVVAVCLAACLLAAGASLRHSGAGWFPRLGGAHGGGVAAAAQGGGAPWQRPPARRGLTSVSPDPAKSPHLVVDTLNLAHWWGRGGAEPRQPLTLESIVAAIEATAPTLRARHPGRVMYVLKDRESRFNDNAAREALRLAAARAGAYIIVAERYADPPSGPPRSAEHSAQGRDDFLMSLLARRWRCAVLTEDRLRDFDRFRATIPPFHVYEFASWRELPEREFVRPDSPAYARLRRPRLVRFADYFGEPKEPEKEDHGPSRGPRA